LNLRGFLNPAPPKASWALGAGLEGTDVRQEL
jgi:hypothetical protein